MGSFKQVFSYCTEKNKNQWKSVNQGQLLGEDYYADIFKWLRSSHSIQYKRKERNKWTENSYDHKLITEMNNGYH